MKILRLLILCLLSIFCLNSCLATAAIIGSMQGDGLLPTPELKNNTYHGNNKKINSVIFSENKKKMRIKNTNKEILVPEGFDLRESPIFLFNNSLSSVKPLRFYLYYKNEERPLPLYIYTENFEEFSKKENLVKINENTYFNKFEDNSKKIKLDQIIKKIDDNIFAVVNIADMKDISKNFFLELMKDW